MGYWAPQPMYQPSGGEPALLAIGDITCTREHVIVPGGRFRLRGTSWSVNQQVVATQATPSWAVVVALVGLFFVCVFSLFFLLAKETRYHGFVDVTVVGHDGLYHTTRIMVGDPYTVPWVHQQVAQAQSLAATA